MITLELLTNVFPACPQERLEHFVEPLQRACEFAELNTRPRVAAFLGQAGHESGQLRHLEEGLNYSAEGILATFGLHFDQASAVAYARQPERIANRAYANRYGNGDEASGDGWHYRGRGIFQVTFKDNYRACSIATCGDADTLLINPEFLADPDYACMSAAWYWASRDLNRWADIDDLDTLTKKINPAKRGLKERIALSQQIARALA